MWVRISMKNDAQCSTRTRTRTRTRSSMGFCRISSLAVGQHPISRPTIRNLAALIKSKSRIGSSIDKEIANIESTALLSRNDPPPGPAPADPAPYSAHGPGDDEVHLMACQACSIPGIRISCTCQSKMHWMILDSHSARRCAIKV